MNPKITEVLKEVKENTSLDEIAISNQTAKELAQKNVENAVEKINYILDKYQCGIVYNEYSIDIECIMTSLDGKQHSAWIEFER